MIFGTAGSFLYRWFRGVVFQNSTGLISNKVAKIYKYCFFVEKCGKIFSKASPSNPHFFLLRPSDESHQIKVIFLWKVSTDESHQLQLHFEDIFFLLWAEMKGVCASFWLNFIFSLASFENSQRKFSFNGWFICWVLLFFQKHCNLTYWIYSGDCSATHRK